MRAAGLIAVAAAIFLADQLVKSIFLAWGGSVSWGGFTLDFTPNYHLWFGLGAPAWVSAAIYCCLLVIIGANLLRIRQAEIRLGLIVILAAGASNLVDRLFRGFVVDTFSIINFYFNLADLALIASALFISLRLLMGSNKKPAND